MADWKIVTFPELPVHDTMWSGTTGSDGRIYMGICGELTGGLSAFLGRYDPVADKTEYLLEMAEAINEPTTNGKATHSKIHTCLVPSRDGKLYIATHCTGAPLNHRVWRPWNCWDDAERMFSGFHIGRYDPATGQFEDFGVQSPNEGSRIMALAEKRGLLYGITYPRCHFYVYDLRRRIYTDVGRCGDINPQCMWIDADENAYTIDDLGYVVKYMADTQELIHTDTRLPFLREIPSVTVYDATLSPDGKDVYGVTWNEDTYVFIHRLFRYNFAEEKIYDLGPVPYNKERYDVAKHHHAGGVVFGDDGLLYLTAGFTEYTPEGGLIGHGMYLYRIDTETLENEEVALLADDRGLICPYVHRAARDFDGRLYFFETNYRPPRLFVYTPDYVNERRNEPKSSAIRFWG